MKLSIAKHPLLTLSLLSALLLAGCNMEMTATRPTGDSAGLPGWIIDFFLDNNHMKATLSPGDGKNREGTLTVAGDDLSTIIPDDGKEYVLTVLEIPKDQSEAFEDLCGESDFAVITPSSSHIFIAQKEVINGQEFEFSFPMTRFMGFTTQVIIAVNPKGERYDENMTIVASYYELSPLIHIPIARNDWVGDSAGPPTPKKCHEI